MGQCISQPIRDDEDGQEGIGLEVPPNENVLVNRDEPPVENVLVNRDEPPDENVLVNRDEPPDENVLVNREESEVNQQPYQSPDSLGDYLKNNHIQYNLPIEQYVYQQWVQHVSHNKDPLPTDCITYHHLAMVLPLLSRYVSRNEMVKLFIAFPVIKESYGAFLLHIIEWQPLSCNISKNWNYLNELHRLTSRKILRVITNNVDELIYSQSSTDIFVPRGWAVETIPFGNTDHAFSLLMKCNESISYDVHHNSGVNLKKIRKLTIKCPEFPRIGAYKFNNWLIRKIKHCFDQICCSSADKVKILAIKRCSPKLVALLREMVNVYLKDFNMKMHIQNDRYVIIIRLPTEQKIKFFKKYSLPNNPGKIKDINHLRIQDARHMVDRHLIPFSAIFALFDHSQATLKRISCDVPLYAACRAPFTVNLPCLTQLSVRVDGPLDIFLTFPSLQILKLTNYKTCNLHVQSIIYSYGDDWYASNIWELMKKLKYLVILRKVPNEHVECFQKFSRDMYEYEYRRRGSIGTPV